MLRISGGSGGALDRVDVLFRDLVDRRINRAHDETLGSERVDIIERGVKVKPPFHVAEHHGHAVVIGCDQLIRLVGQDREGRKRFAFDVRIIPDAGEHDGLAVLAREEIGLLFAVLLAPLVEALGRDHATLIREHGLERAASQRVGAGVEHGWASLAAAAARLIPNRAILVASGLPRSARNAGTCSVGATLGLYSKLMSERVRLRGISLHSLRPRIRLHMAGAADSVSPRGTGAAELKDIYGRCGRPTRWVPPLKRALLLRGS